MHWANAIAIFQVDPVLWLWMKLCNIYAIRGPCNVGLVECGSSHLVSAHLVVRRVGGVSLDEVSTVEHSTLGMLCNLFHTAPTGGQLQCIPLLAAAQSVCA